MVALPIALCSGPSYPKHACLAGLRLRDKLNSSIRRFHMSETKMLLSASVSMFAVSLLSALVLYVLNAGPVWVLTGGTLAGIAVYVAMCMMAAKHTKKESVTGE